MIRKYAEIFCWKDVSSFCSAKATHIFFSKNIRILCIESAKTVNEMTLNELVKPTTLWTTGPWKVAMIGRCCCLKKASLWRFHCTSNQREDFMKALVSSFNLYLSLGKSRRWQTFLTFPRKLGLTIHANYLLLETIYMKCQSLFSGKKKTYFKMSSAENFT